MNQVPQYAEPGSQSGAAPSVPTIDVITVCRNAEHLIGTTMESVAAQSCPPHAYVVIDGASTDGTSGVVSRYAGTLTCYRSEPDSGIAQAMNRALAECGADYVLFLHAGDRFVRNDALAVAAARLAREVPDILACPVVMNFAEGPVTRVSRGLDFWTNIKTGVLHQGAFIRRDLFDRLGGFDESLKIAMDYEFFLRCYRARVCLRKSAEVLTAMDPNGISWRRDREALRARLREERRIHFRHAQNGLARCLYQLYWWCYSRYRNLGDLGSLGSQP